jgi:hypothetical protein
MATLARGGLLRPAKGHQPAVVDGLCARLPEAAREGVRVGGLGVAYQRLDSAGLGLEVEISCWGERGSTGRGEAVAACFYGARAPFIYGERRRRGLGRGGLEHVVNGGLDSAHGRAGRGALLLDLLWA